jgi:hypothetical protein
VDVDNTPIRTRRRILVLVAAVIAAGVVVGEPVSVFDVPAARADEVPCSEGTFSVDGLEPCEDAPPGTYVDVPGATEPTPCAPGTYQEYAASVLCPQADVGHFVPESGADQQTPCDVGTFAASLGQTECDPAPPGTFVDMTGASEATLCPIAFFSASEGSTECTGAEPGHYVDQAGADQQTACPPGTYTGESLSTECEPAPAGTHAPSEGSTAPTDCAPGGYTDVSGSAQCVPAPPGSYVPGTAATGYVPCPPGRYSSTQGATACTLAPAGSFVSTVGATAATLCSIGYFSDSVGEVSCTAAPVGSYVPLPGSDRATLCPAGYYSDAPAASACTPAPPGYYVGAPGSGFALICAPGFTTNGSGATACRDASAPVVTPRFSGGRKGTSGWFVSGPVAVTFDVSDPQSDTERAGCAGGVVSTSTKGTTFTCSATSPGGTTTVPVTVRLDVQDPELVFTGNARTYGLLSRVAITCSATDAISGIASVRCRRADRPTWRFRPGRNLFTGMATDRAGNTTKASTPFEVIVTSRDLCRLTRRFVVGSKAYSAASGDTKKETRAVVEKFCQATSSPKDARAVVKALGKSGYLRPVEARAARRHLKAL